MSELLKFFHVSLPATTRVTGTDLAFHGLDPSWALLIALVIVALTLWIYLLRTPGLAPWKKGLLAFLRSLLLLMILLMLMRPVLLLTVEGTIRRSLLLLIDGSASMQIKDLRQDPDDLKRAAIATGLLDPKKGLASSVPGDTSGIADLSRADVMKAMLTNDKLQLLRKLGRTYDLVPYTFGQTLQALAAPDTSSRTTPASDTDSFLKTMTFTQPYTAIGDSVRALLDLKRGQPLAGILLVTDGGNNYGSDPVDAAALAQQDKVPLYIYGVGITSPHDIIVSRLLAPEVAFVQEEAPVSVLVRSQNMKGRTAKIVLKLGDDIVDSGTINFGDDGEQTVPMKFLPPKKGDYELTASIDPLPDEAVKTNNTASERVRIIDAKIKVLYIEQKPRWEFRYLQGMLLRDRRLDPKFVLVQGDPGLASEVNSPYLAAAPSTREDWLQYDVVILGDVDPHLFSSEQLKSLSDLVSNAGAGIVFLAGPSFMPDAYHLTPMENLLPIELARPSVPPPPPPNPIHLELTAAGAGAPMMKLTDQEGANDAVWKKLPGVYWDARIDRAKPAAEVLLDDPTPEKATRSGPMPVLAVQSYGTGQALFMGTDETWRWRRNVGEEYYTRFWGQVMLRLGLPRLLGASRLTQLATDRKDYVSGERVTISGRLYRGGFQPLLDSSVNGTLTIKPDQPGVPDSELKKSIALQAIPGKPGEYETETVVTTPGVYSFATDTDPSSPLDFRVTEPQFEFGDTALNLALLQKMADTSGGALYREENIYRMLDTGSAATGPSADNSEATRVPAGLGSGTEEVPSPQEVELAFSPLYYAFMILLATVEWILRKRWRLK